MIALLLAGVGLVGLALMVVAAVKAVRLRRGPRPWSDRTTAAVTRAALAWTVLIGLVLLVAPMTTTETTSGSATGGTPVVGARGPEHGPASPTRTTRSTRSLVESEGLSIVGILMAPIAVALVAAVPHPRTDRGRRLGAGWGLMVACLVGSASIGAFYLPAPIALLTAGAKTHGRAMPPSRTPT